MWAEIVIQKGEKQPVAVTGWLSTNGVIQFSLFDVVMYAEEWKTLEHVEKVEVVSYEEN